MENKYLTGTGYFEIKKSKFYSYIYNIDDVSEIEKIIKKIKEENIKAKHIVYAYILKNTAKYSDDNEPTGTAGKAIYSTLIKEKKQNILVVIVRYFGGTLLGTGPLTRAYIKAYKKGC